MKNRKIFVVFSLAILAIAFASVNFDTDSRTATILELNNIEALAGETVSGHIVCTGDGQLFCYLTNKSEYKEITITQ